MGIVREMRFSLQFQRLITHHKKNHHRDFVARVAEESDYP
jgi:hypothetical protein